MAIFKEFGNRALVGQESCDDAIGLEEIGRIERMVQSIIDTPRVANNHNTFNFIINVLSEEDKKQLQQMLGQLALVNPLEQDKCM